MDTLFENIVRELILELSAEDAYAKFYSSLDKWVYDSLMDGVQNITPFHTLVLNCFVKEKGRSDLDDIAHKINFIWKNLDANRKVRLLAKSKELKNSDNNIDSVMDMLNTISTSNEFKSKKDTSSDGYIVVFENDNVLVTCTTTYMANHHYFGNTQWCTASDLSGRYNGYTSFLSYVQKRTIYGYSYRCLLQFKFNKSFVAEGSSYKSSLYQICFNEKNSVILCCNEFDDECTLYPIKDGYVTGNEYNKILSKIPGLIDETKRMIPIEAKYIENYVNKTIDSICDNLPKMPSMDEINNFNIEEVSNLDVIDAFGGKFRYREKFNTDTCIVFELDSYYPLRDNKRNFLRNSIELYTGKHNIEDIHETLSTYYVYYKPEKKVVQTLPHQYVNSESALVDNILICGDDGDNHSCVVNITNGNVVNYNMCLEFDYRVDGGVILGNWWGNFFLFVNSKTGKCVNGIKIEKSMGNTIVFTTDKNERILFDLIRKNN